MEPFDVNEIVENINKNKKAYNFLQQKNSIYIKQFIQIIKIKLYIKLL